MRMSDMMINEKIEMLMLVREYIKEYEAIEAELKDELIEELAEEGVDERRTDIHKVSYKALIENRFNTTAFKKEHKDAYDEYLVSKEVKRFLIA